MNNLPEQSCENTLPESQHLMLSSLHIRVVVFITDSLYLPDTFRCSVLC